MGNSENIVYYYIYIYTVYISSIKMDLVIKRENKEEPEETSLGGSHDFWDVPFNPVTQSTGLLLTAQLQGWESV